MGLVCEVGFMGGLTEEEQSRRVIRGEQRNGVCRYPYGSKRP